MADIDTEFHWPHPDGDDRPPEEFVNDPSSELIDLTDGATETQTFRWGKPEDPQSYMCLLVRRYTTNTPRKYMTNTQELENSMKLIHVGHMNQLH